MEPIESGQIRLILKPTWPDKTGKAWHVSRAGSKKDSVPMKTTVPKQEFEAILDRFMLISIFVKADAEDIIGNLMPNGPSDTFRNRLLPCERRTKSAPSGSIVASFEPWHISAKGEAERPSHKLMGLVWIACDVKCQIWIWNQTFLCCYYF